jgi:hypothetical protein
MLWMAKIAPMLISTADAEDQLQLTVENQRLHRPKD